MGLWLAAPKTATARHLLPKEGMNQPITERVPRGACSLKLTNRDKKTYVLPPTSLTRCIGFVKHMLFYSSVAMKCVDIVFLLSIARLMRLDHTERDLLAEVPWITH